MKIAFAILVCVQPAAVDAAETTIERMRAEWAVRADVLDDSVSEWRIVRHDRSAAFGGVVGPLSGGEPTEGREDSDEGDATRADRGGLSPSSVLRTSSPRMSGQNKHAATGEKNVSYRGMVNGRHSTREKSPSPGLRPPSPANELQQDGQLVARERGQEGSGELVVRVVWGQDGVRVEASCAPAHGVVSARSDFRLDFLAQRTVQANYDAALYSRFTLGMKDVPKHNQPYVFLRTRAKETHFWDTVEDAPPCAAVVGPRQAAEYFDVPIVALMVDALECALPARGETGRPSTREESPSPGLRPPSPANEFPQDGQLVARERGHDRWTELAVRVVMGHACVVIDEDCGEAGTRRYWVDPEHAHRVLRCFVRSAAGELRQQFDYRYSAAAHDAVPQQINILQFRDRDVIHDVLTVERQDFRRPVNVRAAAFEFVFPEDTLVTDFVNRRQYLTRADGGERSLLDSLNPAAIDQTERGSSDGGVVRYAVFGTLLMVGTLAFLIRHRSRSKRNADSSTTTGTMNEGQLEDGNSTSVTWAEETAIHRTGRSHDD